MKIKSMGWQQRIKDCDPPTQGEIDAENTRQKRGYNLVRVWVAVASFGLLAGTIAAVLGILSCITSFFSSASLLSLLIVFSSVATVVFAVLVEVVKSKKHCLDVGEPYKGAFGSLSEAVKMNSAAKAYAHKIDEMGREITVAEADELSRLYADETLKEAKSKGQLYESESDKKTAGLFALVFVVLCIGYTGYVVWGYYIGFYPEKDGVTYHIKCMDEAGGTVADEDVKGGVYRAIVGGYQYETYDGYTVLVSRDTKCEVSE